MYILYFHEYYKMKKIAFIDVDMTLVDNTTSAFNEGLLKFLADGEFDEVYLVTGRNANDLWQHVLQLGNKPEHWRDQLLCNIVDKLKQLKINVAGVSMPYDHYLAAQPGKGKFIIKQAGDAAEQFYFSFEQEIEHLDDAKINRLVIANKFLERTGGYCYVEDPFEPVPNQELSLALPTYLAMIGDTEKKGQFEFLLQRIAANGVELADIDLYFFDDKVENISTAKTIFSKCPNLHSSHTILVDKIHGFEVPENKATSPLPKISQMTQVDTLFVTTNTDKGDDFEQKEPQFKF